jgi:hypothetical protein
MNSIEIFRPFNEAYEITLTILFRPFDFKKWLIIGFAAWLAHIGAGFNFNYRYGGNADFRNNTFFQDITDTIHQIPLWLIISGVTALVLCILALVVVMAWLRARGRFIFIDCLVRNRGVIVEPWREFARPANSYFLFSLGLGIIFVAVVILLSLVFFSFFRHAGMLHLHHASVIIGLIFWLMLGALLAAGWMLMTHLMIIIMYCRRCLATEAWRAAAWLIGHYAGEITLYCLFWIVLGLAAACVACLATCFTCCLAALPYVGTVILLPLYVSARVQSPFSAPVRGRIRCLG